MARRTPKVRIPCDTLRKLYLREGLSQEQIAQEFKTSRQTIHAKMRMCGIPPRDRFGMAIVVSPPHGFTEPEYLALLARCLRVALERDAGLADALRELDPDITRIIKDF